MKTHPREVPVPLSQDGMEKLAVQCSNQTAGRKPHREWSAR